MDVAAPSVRTPRLWALWAASRPSQLALILLIYVWGVGMATVGPPLISRDSAAIAFDATTSTSVALGALALLLVAIPIHYANEAADVDTDALERRTPFSGGSGALIITGLAPGFLLRSLAIVSAVGALVIAASYLNGDLPTDAVVLLCVMLLLGLTYSLPPFSLIRRGVGEAVNAILGGILLPLYGVAVVASPTWYAVLVVLPFTLVVGCNLLAVHWADRRADGAVGKRTLVVRWAPSRIRATFVLLAVSAILLAGMLWLVGIFPLAVAAAHLVPIPFLYWGWRWLTVRRNPSPSVAAMVALALAVTIAWWYVGIA